MQFKSLFLAAAVTAFTAAQDVPTLAAALNSTESLSALNTLIGQFPDLAAALSNLTNATIFAPNNDALTALMEMDGFAELAATDGFVESVLMYHVVDASLPSTNITATPLFVPTMLNDSAYSNVTGGQVIGLVLNGEGDNATAQVISGLAQRSNITDADIAVDVGFVHIISSVLTLPQNVSSTAIAANLTGVAGALIFADLEDAVDTAEDITVFAPNNAAFQAIGSALADITPEALAAILQYHVVAGTVAYSSTLENGTMVEAMDGNQLNITIIDGEVFVNSARVIATDVLVSGGVVHVIDSVLNPNSTNNTPNAEDEQPQSNFEGATEGDVSEITNQVTETVTSTIQVPTAAPAPQDGGNAASTTSEGSAAMPTGAMGAAALFGGVAILAQL